MRPARCFKCNMPELQVRQDRLQRSIFEKKFVLYSGTYFCVLRTLKRLRKQFQLISSLTQRKINFLFCYSRTTTTTTTSQKQKHFSTQTFNFFDKRLFFLLLLSTSTKKKGILKVTKTQEILFCIKVNTDGPHYMEPFCVYSIEH